MLLVGGYILHADFVFSAVQGAPNCIAPCTEQYKACFEKVKESPNDIERELCADEKKECDARCDAEMKEYSKLLEEQELEKKRENALFEEEERARLGQYDLTPEEQEKKLRKWKRSRRLEEQDQEDLQEQDVAPPQEQSEQAPQEQQDADTLNGIKIYQFKW
jgi:hypothetical protein